MVIDPRNNLTSTGAAADKARPNTQRPNDVQPSSRSKASSSGDNVSLSAAGQTLARVQSAIGEGPEVNHAKVAEIKSAIASGTYQVDPQRIAEKLLGSDTQF